MRCQCRHQKSCNSTYPLVAILTERQCSVFLFKARIQVKNKLWTSMMSPEKLQGQRNALSRYHAVCFQSVAFHLKSEIARRILPPVLCKAAESRLGRKEQRVNTRKQYHGISVGSERACPWSVWVWAALKVEQMPGVHKWTEAWSATTAFPAGLFCNENRVWRPR